jgi:hypothetical protein
MSLATLQMRQEISFALCANDTELPRSKNRKQVYDFYSLRCSGEPTVLILPIIS